MRAEDFGADWQMQMAIEEQEQRATETLQQIYSAMVLCGDLEEKSFKELVYLTGIRAKFE